MRSLTFAKQECLQEIVVRSVAELVGSAFRHQSDVATIGTMNVRNMLFMTSEGGCS